MLNLNKRSIPFFALLALCLQGCQTTLPTAAFDYHKAQQRESSGLQNFSVKTPDGNISLQVDAKSSPKISFQDGEQKSFIVEVDIGASSTMRCIIYQEQIDPALSLRHIVKTAMQGRFDNEVALIDSGVFEQYPYLRLDTDYVVDQDRKMLVGQLKSIAMEKLERQVLCFHDELGYKNTFLKTAASIIRSLQVRSEVEFIDPKFMQVLLVKIKNMNVGYILEKTYFSPKNGHKLYSEFFRMLVPQSKTDIIANDSINFEETGPKGHLLEIKYGSQQNEEVSSIHLQKKPSGNAYHVEGQFKGKQIDSIFKTKQPLLSSYSHTQSMAKNFFQGKQKKMIQEVYSPTLSPLKPLKTQYNLLQLNKESAKVQFNLGETKTDIELDPDGAYKNMTMMVGPMELKFIRAFKSGTF